MAAMGGPDRHIHPDFGPNDTGGQPYGIPYSVVSGSTSKVTVAFDYADESDPGPYPFARDTPVEGASDAHALVVDRDACVLYELYAADWNGGHPRAGSGAIWDLRSHALRPRGWTSADAAGLPILPGLLRRDEVAAGEVDHAVRVTAASTDRSYLWPARHQAGSTADPTLPPMGAWFRLKAGFDVSRFRPDTQVVLRAMQRHGLIVADNGSNWYFTGTSEPGWDTGLLDELKTVPAGAFEAVDTSSLMADPDSGRVAGAPATPATTAPRAATTTTARPTTTTRPPTTTTATGPPATISSSPATTPTTAAAEPATVPTTTRTAADGTAAPARAGAPARGPSRTVPTTTRTAADGTAAPARAGAPAAPTRGPSRTRWIPPVLLLLGLGAGAGVRRRRPRGARGRRL
jgi:hypothetical protein